ncbi:hypothetical protein, partial [Streptomyces sp. NPDC001508]|uniref:hypothetical protein n=1 Tax=Streptomyces sp. NPDC001508 TaxID=3154656 RepID=UPI0033255898
MPLSPPSRALSGPRRRTLLASAAGTVLLVGCSGGDGDSGTAGGGPSAADRTRARAARDSRELAARYDAVLAAHPTLARRLRPLRAEVVAHAAAFEEGTAAPSPSPSAASSASAAAAVPARATEALAGLALAERKLADRRAEALLEVPGELARRPAPPAVPSARRPASRSSGALLPRCPAGRA